MEIANLLNFLKRDFFLSFYVGKNKEACKEASKRQHDKLTHTHTLRYQYSGAVYLQGTGMIKQCHTHTQH